MDMFVAQYGYAGKDGRERGYQVLWGETTEVLEEERGQET